MNNAVNTVVSKDILASHLFVGVVLFQDGRSTVGLVVSENLPPFLLI